MTIRFAFTFLLLVFSSNTALAAPPPFRLPPKEELLRLKSAEIVTSKGTIIVALFPEKAPWHVTNLKYLADKGYYNGLPFNFVRPGYLIQTGARGKKVNAGPGYTIPAEFNDIPHKKGTLTMVRKPNDLDIQRTRSSHGSQFRILLSDQPKFDRRFSAFGQVVAGYDVLNRLRSSDRIESITVYVRP